MNLVCNGVTSKTVMLREAIDKYKAAFMVALNNSNCFIQVILPFSIVFYSQKFETHFGQSATEPQAVRLFTVLICRI